MPPHEDRYPLPEDCAVRLIDLDTRVGGLISIGEDGFVNIYLNARLSEDARERALQHELAHYYHDDLFRDANIRDIEREADTGIDTPKTPPKGSSEPLLAMDGSPLSPAEPAFTPEELKRIGRGLYRPEGENLDRARRDLETLRAALMVACQLYDVAQRPPLLPVSALYAACAALDAGDIAFVGWLPDGTDAAQAAVMQLCRPLPSDGQLNAALYYDGEGGPDGALATLELPWADRRFRVTLDLARRGDVLEARAIHREVDGGRYERLY